MPRKDQAYVALLRGINVGGKNVIPMADLRNCFEQMGTKQVTTYIQSGNVLFRSPLSNSKKLVSVIEAALSKSFSYQARVVVIEKDSYLAMVAAAHKSWGNDPKRKHNAMFLVDQMDADELLATLPKPKRGIDTVSTGASVVFWSAKQAMINRSSMMLVAKLPAYKQMTVRNHKTTRKLAELLAEFD